MKAGFIAVINFSKQALLSAVSKAFKNKENQPPSNCYEKWKGYEYLSEQRAQKSNVPKAEVLNVRRSPHI